MSEPTVPIHPVIERSQFQSVCWVVSFDRGNLVVRLGQVKTVLNAVSGPLSKPRPGLLVERALVERES